MYAHYQSFRQQNGGMAVTQQPAMSWNGSQWKQPSSHVDGSKYSTFNSSSVSTTNSSNNFTRPAAPSSSSTTPSSEVNSGISLIAQYTEYYHQWTSRAGEQEKYAKTLPVNSRPRAEAQRQADWSKYYADQSSRAAHYYHQNPHCTKAPFDLPPAPPRAVTPRKSQSTASTNGHVSQVNSNPHTTGPQKQADAAHPSAPPEGLKRFVHRCLQVCSTDEQKKSVQKTVEGIIAEALKKGDLHSKNWDSVPVPSNLLDSPDQSRSFRSDTIDQSRSFNSKATDQSRSCSSDTIDQSRSFNSDAADQGRNFSSVRTDQSCSSNSNVTDHSRSFNSSSTDQGRSFNVKATDQSRSFNSSATEQSRGFSSTTTEQSRSFSSNETNKSHSFSSNDTGKSRSFSSHETDKSRSFSSHETDKSRSFSSNETDKSNSFSSNETDKSRSFSTNETDKRHNFSSKETDKSRSFNSNAADKSRSVNSNETDQSRNFNSNATDKSRSGNSNAIDQSRGVHSYATDKSRRIVSHAKPEATLEANQPYHKAKKQKLEQNTSYYGPSGTNHGSWKSSKYIVKYEPSGKSKKGRFSPAVGKNDQESYYGPAVQQSPKFEKFVSGRKKTKPFFEQEIPSKNTSIGNTDSHSVTSSDSLKGKEFVAVPSLKDKSKKKKKVENENDGFSRSSSVLNKRASRFAGRGGGAMSSTTRPDSDYTIADRYMGKGLIGGSQKKLEDSDYETMTVKGTCEILEKSYLRLTEPPRAELVRPIEVLKRHVRNLKAEREGKSKNRKVRREYNWFCSQFKAVRQDCTVQRIQNEFTVDVYETHARIALEEGDLNEYNQCQTQLIQLYELLRYDRASLRNRCEFLAYRLIYYVYLTGNKKYDGGSSDLFKIMLSLTPEQREDTVVKHALQVRASVADVDYHKFFRLQDIAPNFGAYLMDYMVPNMRLWALQRICKAYRPSVDVKFVLNEIGFETKTEAQLSEGKVYLESCGCVLSETNSDELLTKDSVVRESDLHEKSSLI